MSSNVSRLKIIAGFVLLLAVLFFALTFVGREMDKLARTEVQDVRWADSLIALLRKQDENTIRMLRDMARDNERRISTDEIAHIIALHDTLVTQQHIKRRVVTHRDTTVVRARKKNFFRRLGEVFVPPKEDTAIQVKTSREYALDTIVELYNPVDTLQKHLQVLAAQRRADSIVTHRRNRNLQRMNRQLSARIDSLLKNYETTTMEQAHQEAERRQALRRHSAQTLGGIAVGAVLLAAFFLLLIGRDVARSNRYRRELEEARRKAEDLLATREKLMLAITHDFKAPLGSIMGYADLLSRLTVDERQRFYLDNMKTSSQHLLKLVVDLLDFHRLDLHKVEVNRVSFHPARLLDEVRVSFQPLTTAKGLSLDCQVDPALEGTFVSDPLRLRQILTNLISNAVKFTDRGGITLTARYEDRQLRLAVADTGKGMEPADCERIFQEFIRLPGAQGKEGFGLGLSIVKMLVQLLEGTISVESTPGQGSTFLVCLPLYPVGTAEGRNAPPEARQDHQPQLQPPAESPAPCAGKRLLLIDDDRIQLSLTTAMLRQGGMDAVACLQVDELLDALRTDRFDALLTDVQMPAISGFDLLRLLRASNIGQARSIPVIAVTARSDMARADFVAHGFAGCLHKPFTVSELTAELSGMPVPEEGRPQDTPADAAEGLSIGALTAYSDGDAQTARDILDSFLAETRQNAHTLQQATATGDVAAVAAVAHKMIPLFTLIRATALVACLRSLESLRDAGTSAEGWQEKAQTAHTLLADVLRQVEAYKP